MVLRSRFVRWVSAGLVLAACGGSEADDSPAAGSSGTSGKGTSGSGSSGVGGLAGGAAAGKGGAGGAGATSRGGSGDSAGEGGMSDAPSSGGISSSGKGGAGGSIVVGAGGSANAAGNLDGAGSGNEGGDGTSSSIDACLGEVPSIAFPPPCKTALVPLDDEIARCEFSMPKPSGVSLELDGFNVTYTSDLGSSFVPRVNGPGGCDEAPESGFYYGSNATPFSIVLCPCTCAAAQAGDGELDALYGCPTLVR